MSIVVRLAPPLLCFCVALNGAADSPALSPRDVVNAADHSVGGVAPGEIVVLFPSNAGPEILSAYELTGEGRVASVLGETRVWFDGIAAPINYSVRGQVGAVVPYEVSNQETTKVVVEYKGMRSPPVTLSVVHTAPALFTLDSSGRGQAAMLNETGCCNSARNPAARGSVAALYATGDGQTSPAGITGSVSMYARVADYPAPRRKVRVTVGGAPAEIVWAGEAPHTVAGLLQVNFRVPAKSPAGDAIPIVLTVGESRSADGVTMAVRSAVKRILVIDNDTATRSWLRKVLLEAGYAVLTAQTGAQAQAQAREHPVDMVISSLSIPEAERLEMIDRMRVDRPLLKIVAIARALDAETLRSADLFGCQAVFTKPMTAKSVLPRVQELLRSRPVPYVAGQSPVSLNRKIPR